MFYHHSYLIPQMYSSRSKLFWMGASWKKGTLGAVRGASTMTCSWAMQHRQCNAITSHVPEQQSPAAGQPHEP
jgi:hypothetical protein